MARTVTSPIPAPISLVAPGRPIQAPDHPDGGSGWSDYVVTVNSIAALKAPCLVNDSGYTLDDKFLTYDDPSTDGRRWRIKTPHKLGLPSGPHVSLYVDKKEAVSGTWNVNLYVNDVFHSTLDFTAGASGVNLLAHLTLDDTAEYNEIRLKCDAGAGTGHFARGVFVTPYLGWSALPAGVYDDDLCALDTTHIVENQAAATWILQDMASLLWQRWQRCVPTLGNSARIFDTSAPDTEMIADVDPVWGIPPGVSSIEVHVWSQKEAHSGGYLKLLSSLNGQILSTPSSAAGDMSANAWYVFTVPLSATEGDRITLEIHDVIVESVMICCADASV